MWRCVYAHKNEARRDAKSARLGKDGAGFVLKHRQVGLRRSMYAINADNGNRSALGGISKTRFKKTKRDIAVCALLLWSLASPVFAQSGLDLFSSHSDVLYSQSGLWDLLNQSSFSPSMDIDLPKVTSDISRKASVDSATENRAAADLLRNKIIQPVIRPGSNTRVKWMPALMESLYYTGIMHSFDITTEAGTRDTLNGHWFQHYMESVGSLRGWSDGDTFMAPYAGHPIERSVFGYILRQNDPKYRGV